MSASPSGTEPSQAASLAAPQPPPRPRGGPAAWRERWLAADAARPVWHDRFWTAVLLVMLAFVAWRLGAFHWSSGVTARLPDGRALSLPDTFASGDHPFHIAKERAALDALRHGWLPRWFAFHQSGFPAEFYPAGADAVVVALYVLAIGQIPLAICHKLVVIGVLCLPPVAYWALARRERLPVSVAVVASALHLLLRGTWLAGGPYGLLHEGLWPDVFASYLPLFVILWGGDWLRFGRRRGLLLTTLAATLAMYSNPRSLIGLGVALAAVVAIAATERRGWRRLVGRAALLGLLLGLLSASLVLPLRAHQARYDFAQYVRFEHPGQLRSYYTAAIPPLVIGLAALGIALALARGGFYNRVLTLLLPLSLVALVLVGWTWRNHALFAQLEGPRLLPLLRPATLWLAALALHETLRGLLALVRARGAALIAGGVAVGGTLALLALPASPLTGAKYGVPVADTTGGGNFAGLTQSALQLEQSSAPSDKTLVLGNPLALHSGFWISALTGRYAYLDDWVWSWRQFPFADKTRLRDDTAALELSFLETHGLSWVLIDGSNTELLAVAATKPYLRLAAHAPVGGYLLLRVEPPDGASASVVAFDDGPVTQLDVTPQRITAVGHVAQASTAIIRVNAFPGWRATVNGHAAQTVTDGDGYMRVALPAGDVRLTLTYGTTRVVWLGRALVALGLALLLALTLPATVARRARYRLSRLAHGLRPRRVDGGQHA